MDRHCGFSFSIIFECFSLSHIFFLFACSSEDSSLCEAQAMIQKEQHRCMMIFYSELLSKREDILEVQIIDEMNIWRRYYKCIKSKVVYDIDRMNCIRLPDI